MWRAVTRRVEIQTTNISKSFSQNGGQLETTSVRKRTVRIIINTGIVSKTVEVLPMLVHKAFQQLKLLNIQSTITSLVL